MMNTKKGQLSIVNIFSFMILVIIMAILTPFISGFISDMISNGNYSDIQIMVANAIVPLMWVGLIITFFLYLTPIRPNQY